ncbi:MAG: pseudouridylate synthase [Myxococcales bacterium]|jgi:tRNA pseudouridine65 synthase|nr:pseudouridylate synthase [Myxococcales bacterium]
MTSAAFLFRDEWIVAVDKPSGVAVHRGWAAEPDVMLARVRDAVGAYVYPVHRLDRGASGVLLFALDPETARALGDAFTAQRVHKRYLALVRGVPPDRVRIDHPVKKGERDGERVPAVTVVERLEVLGRYALVAACPETGRLHQIRRHLKHISCPLIGDVRYGKGEHNRLFRDRYGLHRLFLHAEELRLEHPRTGEPLVVRAPLGPDLAEPLARLREDVAAAR